MKKHKKHKPRFRNAAPGRNATAPRPARVARDAAITPLRRLGYTAAGAAGTALIGSFLAREGWAPKTIATALTAVGAGLAWKGDADTTKSLGAGTMSAAGSQLALMLMDEHGQKTSGTMTAVAKRPANAEGLPPGSLERAFERARARLAQANEDAV